MFITVSDSLFVAPLLPLLLGVAGPGESWEQAVRAANSESVVFITVKAILPNHLEERSTGTGFMIGSDGFVLTCNHVLPRTREQTTLEISGAPGGRYEHSYPLTLVKRDDDLDLALLKLPAGRVRWRGVQLGDSTTVRPDSKHYVLGYPLQQDLSGVSGQLSNMNVPGGKWLSTAPINHGTSGGPVFDEAGRVIAVAAGGYEQADQMNVLIPLQFASHLLPIAGLASGQVGTMQPGQIARRADLRVATVPDTVAIVSGGYQAVAYEFSERRGLDVQVETQDAQYLTTSGTPLGQPCNGCRILGGTFTLEGGKSHTLWDNVYLPAEIVAEARTHGTGVVNLRTTFNCKDRNGNSLTVTAVLKVFALVKD